MLSKLKRDRPTRCFIALASAPDASALTWLMAAMFRVPLSTYHGIVKFDRYVSKSTAATRGSPCALPFLMGQYCSSWSKWEFFAII